MARTPCVAAHQKADKTRAVVETLACLSVVIFRSLPRLKLGVVGTPERIILPERLQWPHDPPFYPPKSIAPAALLPAVRSHHFEVRTVLNDLRVRGERDPKRPDESRGRRRWRRQRRQP